MVLASVTAERDRPRCVRLRPLSHTSNLPSAIALGSTHSALGLGVAAAVAATGFVGIRLLYGFEDVKQTGSGRGHGVASSRRGRLAARRSFSHAAQMYGVGYPVLANMRSVGATPCGF